MEPRLRPYSRYRWTEEEISEALREFERREGRRPVLTDIQKNPVSVTGLPNAKVFERVFGTFSNAVVETFGESNPQVGYDDADTEQVIEALRKGATLAGLGAERGISGQALGRRVEKYCKRYGIRHPMGPKARRKGRPKRGRSSS